jgi:hypothetical protein
MTLRTRTPPLAAALAITLLAACGGDSTETGPVIDPGDGGEYSVGLDPADFTTVIDNPLLPLLPGNRWVYEGEGERTEVTVTDRTGT